MWDAANITYEDKQISQFAGALRKRVLTWYMNFTESQNRAKAKIKASFLAFFKIEDVAHLVAQKLKDIKPLLGEYVWVYDKRFKDILSQISLNIDVNLLV